MQTILTLGNALNQGTARGTTIIVFCLLYDKITLEKKISILYIVIFL